MLCTSSLPGGDFLDPLKRRLKTVVVRDMAVHLFFGSAMWIRLQSIISMGAIADPIFISNSKFV